MPKPIEAIEAMEPLDGLSARSAMARAFALVDQLPDLAPLRELSPQCQVWVVTEALTEFVGQLIGEERVSSYFRHCADDAAKSYATGLIVTREDVGSWALAEFCQPGPQGQEGQEG